MESSVPSIQSVRTVMTAVCQDDQTLVCGYNLLAFK